MYCTNCGEENQGTSKFCFNCGKPLKEISSIQLVKSEILKKVEARAIQSRLYAGFLKRVFAFLLDIILLICLNIVLKIAVSMNLIEPAAASLTSFISLWFYFASMESSEKQATLGKLALRIKVVSTTGDRISFGRATARHFSRIASAFILLIGYLMVAITAKKQALHDKMANCLVVNKAVTADRIKEDGLASPLSKPVLVGLIVFTCCIPVTGIIAAIVVPAYQD